ncbi:MAG: DUF3604 domain-containing protein [Candidatus Marinimicrobia bacterium]|nr:DUF3604 domain-containing protein [Candidatus Neomarinimicrobiota bacterium]
MKRFFSLIVVLLSFLLAGEISTTTPIESLSALGVHDVKLSSHPFTGYPDICEDIDGYLWVTYMELKDGLEFIIVKKISNKLTTIDSFIVSEEKGIEYRPRITCAGDNKVWVVWSAKRNGNWDIFARSIYQEQLSKEFRVSIHEGIDIRPAICSNKNGGIWIAWETLRQDNFDICVKFLSSEKINKPILLTTDAHMDLRPQIKCDGDGQLYVVWDRQIEDSYRVLLKTINQGEIGSERLISSQFGFNLAPAIAVSGRKSIWIAWQSNLRASGKIDQSPWIQLRNLKGKKISAPVSLAGAGDWQKSGEDQGFEFPSLIVDESDRLWVFGRPSQGFFLQIVSGGRKSALYKFDVGGWGGRGQLVTAIRSKDDNIYTVRRDIRYIYLTKINASQEIPMIGDVIPLSDNTGPVLVYPKLDQKPQKTLPLPDQYKIFFGDIHKHSSLSDGMGTVDECYTRSKFFYRQDFATLTDHEWFTGKYLMPSEWEWIKIIGQYYNNYNDFTTVPAYEWTTARIPKGYGHKNVYFPTWDQPIFSHRFEAKDTQQLFEYLKKSGGIAIPHHIAWTGLNWKYHNPEIQPVFEIISTHGAFEYMGNEPITHRGGIPGYFVQDGFKQDLVFGIVGGTDGHGLKWHHGISRKQAEWETGLTAIITRENTIESFFDALKHRRVYATSGAPIQIDFRINDQFMGSVIETIDVPEISLNILGSGKLHYVYIVRDNQNILVLGKDREEGKGVKRTYVDNDLQPGKHWYYVRVVQEDGEMAWTSPIWVYYKMY